MSKKNQECRICKVTNNTHKMLHKGASIKNGLCIPCAGIETAPQVNVTNNPQAWTPEIAEAMRG
jgi:hypothetical protein